MFIQRTIAKEVLDSAKSYPVVTITGPRQSGKTTLVKALFPDKPYYTFENPDIRTLALTDPNGFLAKVSDGAVFDEIQQVPELLSYIQGIVDSVDVPGQFILTGSQHFSLMKSVTQSLAGRTALLKLLPFSIRELSCSFDIDHYLLYGFYPRIHDKKLNPTKAYRNYLETYIQRDLRQLIQVKDLNLFQKFIKLCAGRVGQIFIANNLANELGVSLPTINSWVSILEASYIIFRLEPYWENIGKRLIKSSKMYFYDVGLAAYLLGVENITQMERDPLRGALFENLIITDLIKERFNLGLEHNLFFYRDSHNHEVDVVFKSGHNFIPIEIKSASTFVKDFLKGLDYFKRLFGDRVRHGYIIYAGDSEYMLNDTQIISYKNAYTIVNS